MRKTYVQFINAANGENGEVKSYRYGSGEERFALYSGISQLHGGWLMETSGDPITLTTLEEADNSEKIIASIDRVLSSIGTDWKALTEEDEEYIADFLAECGIEE